jgi:hypothetical protein
MFGHEACQNLTIGNFNVGIGAYALSYINGGSYNVAIGYEACRLSVSVRYNVGIGYRALRFNATGGNNIAIGQNSSYALTNSISNISIGASALGSGTLAENNIAFGVFSLYKTGTTTGTTTIKGNIALGYQAGYDNLIGEYNVLIGSYSGKTTLGNYNTCVGTRAGYSVGTGINNTYVGAYSAEVSTNASHCISIGYKSGSNNTVDYRLHIDVWNTSTPLIYGEFDNNLVRINGSLDVTGSIKTNGTSGVSGTFTTVDGKTITVANGIVTSIV